MMTGWQIAFVVSVVVLGLLLAYNYHADRKRRHRILADEQCRRWYPTMQRIADNTRGKWDERPN